MSPSTLKELALLFTKLGVTGFGGPAVHIAMMEDEVVRKRGWMEQQQFLDLVGATNLIPGPNSTELAMHIGRERGGWKGLVVAGACFILPAVLLTGIIAWAYQRWGSLPAVKPFVYGIQPTIVAVITVIMFRLARKALRTGQLMIIGFLALALALGGFNEIYILFGLGLLGVLLSGFGGKVAGVLPLPLLQGDITRVYPGSEGLFFIFLKIGAILYGSGYVLFSFLDAELVSRGLLSKQQLIDAVAAGQFTPGPVFSSATFIGWQIGGLEGAALATIGIFLPSFLFVAALNPVIPLLRKKPWMAAFLDAVNAASIALVFALMLTMGASALTEWRTTVLLVTGIILALAFPKLNTAWLVLVGIVGGWMVS